MRTVNQEQFKQKFGEDSIEAFSELTPKRSFLSDVAIGAAKGAGDTAFEIGNLLTEGGRFIQAGIDPTKTIAETRTAADKGGMDIFSGDRQEVIRKGLEATNNAQLTGKAGEFVLEFLFPLGKITGGFAKAGSKVDDIVAGAQKIGDDVVEGGVKVKDRILDTVADLDDKTKTALDRVDMDIFESVLEQGKKAMTDDRIVTPIENVGHSIIKGLRQTQDQLRSLGARKGEILDSANLGFQKVGNVGGEALLDLQKTFSKMRLDDADHKVINKISDQLKLLGSNPRLRDVDETIDLLQDTIYKNTRPNAIEITDRVTGQLRKIVGELNSKVKDLAGDEYKAINQEYREKLEFITELNARLGKEGANAGAYVKRLFSPSDARTKELLQQLENFTGNDYFRDARIAKFVMDVLGDTRAASLLRQIPDSASGVVGKAIDFAKEKIADPIDAARRRIKGKQKP